MIGQPIFIEQPEPPDPWPEFAEDSGLVLAYLHNDGANLGLDSGTLEQHLTNVNGVTLTTGVVLGAANYVADDTQHLRRFPYVSALGDSIAAEDFWVAQWVWLTAVTGVGGDPQAMLGAWKLSSGGRVFRTDQMDDRFRFIVSADGNNAVLVSSNTFGVPSAGQWHFYFAVRDSVTDVISISIDGGDFDSVAFAANVRISSGTPLKIGANTDNTDAAISKLDGKTDIVLMGFSPAGGISAQRDAIRDYLYNGGLGREPAL